MKLKHSLRNISRIFQALRSIISHAKQCDEKHGGMDAFLFIGDCLRVDGPLAEAVLSFGKSSVFDTLRFENFSNQRTESAV